MKKVVLTGGGTAGHVTPNLALVPTLKENDCDILYIGSYNGIEKELITQAHLPYKGISSGKLRRYFDLKNFSDPFRVIKGYFEARRILKDYRPDVVFSKGGFVAVPVVLAAKHYKIPVIIHESDMTPGLANKICIPCAVKVCCNFPETMETLPGGKAVLSGSPIRKELLEGSRERGLELTGFTGEKPVIMVIGGSLGAVHVNNAIRAILPRLLKTYDVIHICGRGNLDASQDNTSGYVQYEYVDEPLKDLFAAADIVVSRAGANSICEILALRKPNVLIPLSAEASRGDQVLNARSFEKQGYSRVLEEKDLTDDTLMAAIDETCQNRDAYIDAMEKSSQSDAINIITGLILSYAGQKG